MKLMKRNINMLFLSQFKQIGTTYTNAEKISSKPQAAKLQVVYLLQLVACSL
jgi:hypothetical protein